MNTLRDILLKILLVLGVSLGCGMFGFAAPMLFDRDVGGAMASVLCGSIAVVIGIFLGLFAVRRAFD